MGEILIKHGFEDVEHMLVGINAGLLEVDEQNANILDLGKNEYAASAMADA